jgi:hypothetical protein
MLLAVTALIVGARAVNVLLVRIATSKVIEMLGAPTLVRASFEFLATGLLTTDFLALLDSGVGGKPVTTNTAPGSAASLLPPRQPLSGNSQPRARRRKSATRKRSKKPSEKRIRSTRSKREKPTDFTGGKKKYNEAEQRRREGDSN